MECAMSRGFFRSFTASLPRTRERGPAMDVKALSPDVIKKKILDVALSMTGADDGDIEAHCCHVLFFTEWLAGGTVFF